MRAYPIVALIFATACGGTSPNTGDDMPVMDADVPADAYIPPDGYTRLIGRTWSLAPGATDIYKCVRFTIPQDMYITNINAQAPLGTHHTVLSIAGGNGSSGADGEQDCNVGTLGMVMLYASGVGTSPLDFPTGVGIKVSAGQQIHLNLHLYNAGDEPLTGESAIWVKSQPTPPPTLAEMVFAGSFNVYLQPNATMTQTVTGECQATSDYSLFALWPHMHKLATKQLVEHVSTSGTAILHEQPYMFEEQKYWPQQPLVQVKTNDKIRVTCSYINDTNKTVTWGDSSDQEMCFAGLYRYPAKNSGIFECNGM
jgi:hypothetical protein